MIESTGLWNRRQFLASLARISHSCVLSVDFGVVSHLQHRPGALWILASLEKCHDCLRDNFLGAIHGEKGHTETAVIVEQPAL